MKEYILDEYYDYHRKRYVKGEVSSLSRLECIVIEVFLDWLLKNYNVRHK